MNRTKIEMPKEKIAEFCQKLKIVELSLFGSVLREDFRPDSDVDVLVTFAPDAQYSLFDLVHIEEELKEILGRKVDLKVLGFTRDVTWEDFNVATCFKTPSCDRSRSSET